MKLNCFKCDRCGKSFRSYVIEQGVKDLNTRRAWDLCNECCKAFDKFISEIKDEE